MPRPPDAPDLPRITAAEWPVAEVVWRAGRPLSSTEIVDRLSVPTATAAHPKTVRTLLHRLARKGVLATERRGRTSHYFPRLSRGEYVDLEARSLLDRVFEGRRGRLLLHFLGGEAADLSSAEIALLRERLDALESGAGGRGPR